MSAFKLFDLNDEAMNYESPIKVTMGQMRTQFDGELFKAIQDVNVDVDKDELIKALEYDRQQYVKGYTDGKKYAEDFANVKLARCLAAFTQSIPCDFHCIDEKSINDEWCEAHCGNISDYLCWKHAIDEGWLDEWY